MLRSAHICLMRRRELRTQLSYISVKEAIDSLQTGLLFYRPEGDILLCNRRMDALARQMTGQALQNGVEFRRLLDSGPLCGCERETLGGQQVFRLPDSSVWSVSAHDIPMGCRTLVLLTGGYAVCNGLANVCSMHTAKTMDSSLQFPLLSAMVVVFTALLAWAVFHEKPGRGDAAGLGLTVAGMALLVL